MIYTVQRGDTLSTIARRHGTTVNDILKLNPEIKNPDLIYAGQTITLPGSGAKTGTENAGTAPAPAPRPSGKVAYLTFDDGPSSTTPLVLDVLKKYNVRATFFVIGNDTPQGHSLYKRIVAEGHQLGNHTYSHNYGNIYQSLQNFTNDFYRLEKLLQNVAGVKPEIMRYPGGSNNTVSNRFGGSGVMRQIILEMARRGYVHCDWNVDGGDATHALKNSALITQNTLSQAAGKEKAIILLHDGDAMKATTIALPQIIEGLRSRGFQFGVLTKDSFRVQFVK